MEAGILFNEHNQNGKIFYNSKMTTFHNRKCLQVVWFLVFFSISSPELSEELGHLEQKKKLQQELRKSKKETSSSLHMELSQNVYIPQ